MNTAPRLWLLRHAPPLIAPGICYGQLDVAADAALTHAAAKNFSAALAAATAKNFSAPPPLPVVVHHSPLQRCEQLAQALSALHPDFTPISAADPRLQEMDFGRWEGRPWDAIPHAEVDAWAAHLATTAPGGGEPLAAMLQRVHAALQHSWQHDSQGGTRDVVWVTHAGVIRCVQWLLRQHPRAPTSADWRLPAPACGQWLEMPWAAAARRLQALPTF